MKEVKEKIHFSSIEFNPFIVTFFDNDVAPVGYLIRNKNIYFNSEFIILPLDDNQPRWTLKRSHIKKIQFFNGYKKLLKYKDIDWDK